MKRIYLPLVFFPATISLIVDIIAVILKISSKSASSLTFPTTTEVWIFTTVMTLISALCLMLDLTKGPLLSIQKKEDISSIELPWEKEIKLELRNVISEVKKARSIIEKYDALEITEDPSLDIDEIIHTAHATSRTALLLLYAKLAEQMIVLLQEAGVQSQTSHGLSHETLDEAARKGLIPSEMISASHDFASLRNKFALDADFEIDEDTLFSLLSTGIELLKSISARRANRGKMN